MVRGDYMPLAWMPGAATFKPLSAIGFFFAGIIILCGRNALGYERRLASVLVSASSFGLIFVVFGATVDQLAEWRLSLVDLTMLDKHFQHTIHPGMPSAGTLLGFIFSAGIGIAVIFNSKNFSKRAVVCGRLLVALSLMVLMGYATGRDGLAFDWPHRSTAMSIPSAVLFLLTGLGAFALARSRPAGHGD